MLLWIIGFSILGSIGAVAGASLLLLLPEKVRKNLVPSLISYATGTLLGAAFLGMIPAGLAKAPAIAIMTAVLGGIVIFFALEKFLLWRHCHDTHCEVHGNAAPLILVGDALHNFVDGVVIAAAFLTSIPLGIVTAFAVIAHEIPQEVGDFAILLENGYERKQAMILNSISAATTLPGAVIAYFWLGEMHAATPYILAISAASFIYIAIADLIPGLHRQVTLTAALRQLTLLLAGIGTIALFHTGG
ncbi:ZIP family metal transporter [Nitrosomonas sp.]|uniref:ZIP family metal transporter n=1 Tax=Nitrosomonas sp. TaxID=42353 RepID=UPI001DDC6083|nr:ZIP family metal transporter [Nitrosomonas sp.]MCB1950033.1 ZIP family metal transporter [Nitrosomonas sp.]MCP5242412.1 ZIP family metal transporter [Burkholderiales bacterium]MDR4514590.1 ZIP family metal transporter [Nitrosomonas sp.]